MPRPTTCPEFGHPELHVESPRRIQSKAGSYKLATFQKGAKAAVACWKFKQSYNMSIFADIMHRSWLKCCKFWVYIRGSVTGFFMLSMCVKLMVRNHGNSYILQSEGGANNLKHTSTYVLSIHIENFQNVLHLKFISPYNLACDDQIIACDRTLIRSIVDLGTNKVLSYMQCNLFHDGNKPSMPVNAFDMCYRFQRRNNYVCIYQFSTYFFKISI